MFIADLAESAQFRFNKKVQAQLETAVWLCLSGGRSREQPTVEEHASGDVCGHVFLKNEIVYRCRTCGMDDTCVLCSRCFNAESHRGHDVLFSVSGGNGCCDCGDLEAWKHSVGCKIHSPSASPAPSPASGESQDDLTGASEISTSARLTIRSVLVFVAQQFRSFTFPKRWNTASPPEALISYASQPTNPLRPLAVLLYNDEAHSFEDVIRQLVQTTGCTREEAKARADVIDSIGREVVLISPDLQRCLLACQELELIRFRCTVERLEDVFLQSLTPTLLDFCTRLAKLNPGYRRAICEELCLPSPVSRLPERLDAFLKADLGLWKAPRTLSRDLCFASLLLDSARFKEVLGARFIAHYPALVDSFLKYDPEPDLSLVTISLQLFTTPSVVHYLVTKCDLLGTIIGTLKAFYAEAIPADPTLLINCEHSAFMNDRYSTVFYDLKYILAKPSVGEHIASNPRHLHNFLGFLALFQGMHPQVRAMVTHVEYESQLWIKVFSLAMFLTRTIPLFAACFPLLPSQQQHQQQLNLGWAITTAREYIKQWQVNHLKVMRADPALEHALLKTVTLQTRFGDFPILHRLIATFGDLAPSFHNMLHWFLASLIRHGMTSPNADSLDLTSLFRADQADYSVLWLIEGPIRVQVVLAQVAAGLWRKNGMSMANQVRKNKTTLNQNQKQMWEMFDCFFDVLQAYQYKGFLMRDQTYDHDLLFVQTGAVVLGAEHIISLLMDRFSLTNWFGHSPDTSFDETQCAVMAEEFFGLLIGVHLFFLSFFIIKTDFFSFLLLLPFFVL